MRLRAMTLHEAMEQALRSHSGRMPVEQMAKEIALRDLYRCRDGQHPPVSQLYARANKYPQFECGAGEIWLRAAPTNAEVPASAHRLPDLLEPGLKVVFCGTAAGNESARVGYYYAGTGNRFWPVLYEVGFTPRQLHPSEFRELIRYGIGLTDLAKATSGMDWELADADFDRVGLLQKVRDLKPAFLALTSKNTAKELFQLRAVDYGRLCSLGETEVWVLPSGAARGSWDEGVWRALALQGLRDDG